MKLRLAFALLAPLLALGATNPAPDSIILAPTLPRATDPQLRRNVDFWIRINTRYTSSQGVVHDARYVDKIYEALDFTGHPGLAGHLSKLSKRKWRAVLLSLHKKWAATPGRAMPAGLTDDEKHVYELYKDVDEPDKFLKAAEHKRLRFQLGQKNNFLDGLYQSGRFLPLMEEVFRREGLPVELTRLPFVESSFNLRARSKVGASGIWQFMRPTGRLFLSINDAVDERNDPVRATEAAAKLLKMNYDSLGSWPLAVTAYNHGRKGVMRAVIKVGSDDLSDVVANYRSRSFGFASSNFYPELLAVIEIEKNAGHYFGNAPRAEPESYIEMKLPDSVKVPVLARFLKLDRTRLKQLNPALNEDVLEGFRLIPAGYSLRLPTDKGVKPETAARLFSAGYSEIPAIFKLKAR